jgi:hypothetical protein
MKLSVATNYRQLLLSIKAAPVGSRPSYPKILPQDYLPVWNTYLNLQVVKDLYKRYVRLEAFYYICMGFVSFIESLYPEVDRQIAQQSLNNYDPANSYRTLLSFLRSTGFLTNRVLLHKHTVDLNFLTTAPINAIHDIISVGVLEFKMNGKTRLTEHLFTTKLFASVPEVLTKQKSYPLSSAAKLSKKWVLVPNAPVELRIIRAKFDTLLIEYRFLDKSVLFLGSLAESDAKMALLGLQRKSLKL